MDHSYFMRLEVVQQHEGNVVVKEHYGSRCTFTMFGSFSAACLTSRF